MLVKDYKGQLIPKEKARKIPNEGGGSSYYEMGVSCIKMDDGKWYRITTGKIIYDNSLEKWIFASSAPAGKTGLVKDGAMGFYSDISGEVVVNTKKELPVSKKTLDTSLGLVTDEIVKDRKWTKVPCISEPVAISLGFVESIFDGQFYRLTDCTSDDKIRLTTPNIPASERHSTYSLDDDKDYRGRLEKVYDDNDLAISPQLKRLARKYIPFTFGLEIEIQNGFVPKKIRESLGFRTCRDGSLDHGENGVAGQEYVSIPMEGGKGLQAVKNLCDQLTKRCVISNKCSIHIHFGDVRRDRLYVISLWNLLVKLQDELRKVFPYSRTNSIRDDGKIYAALLPDLGLKLKNLLSVENDEDFKTRVTNEFIKIYSWLNNGHPPGEVFEEAFVKDTKEAIIKGKVVKQYCYRVKQSNYSTKLPRHAIQGQKWLKPQRYLLCNFLNFFFAHSKTIEFRIHEATTNFDKILMYLLTCVAILKYAENFEKTLSNDKITLKQMVEDHYPADIASRIMYYWDMRHTTFCTTEGGFKSGWKNVEQTWFNNDKTFNFSL